MSLIVSSDAMSLRTLTELTDKQIARVIQTVNGVGEVSLAGGRAREIHIVVDIEKLNSYGLSMTEVRDAVVAENVEIPGGTVEQGKGQLLLRTLGRVDASNDFNDIVVATRNGTPIRVSDIGGAEDTFQRPTSAVWLGKTPAVMLDVRRAMGENTVAVIEGVRAKLATIERSLPSAVKVTVIRDDSRFIYASIASLEEHLIFGALFATIVVMIFIRNLRAVLISALAIPASIISSFTLMNIMGFTLNNMTLLGITLAVGIVIDDAIVVLENIFRYIEEKGCSPFEAAIEGTREVALAVMATTLSLVVIFLPIAFMSGYRQAVHQSVRLDDCVRDPGVDARQLHADADAQLAVPEAVGRGGRLEDEGRRLLSLARRVVHPAGQLGARSSDRRSSASRVVTVLMTFPLNRMVGREFVPDRGHGRMDRPRRRAGRHVARRARPRSRSSCSRNLSGIEGVAQIEPSVGVSGMTGSSPTHIHFLCQALPIDERKNTQAEIITEMRRRLAAHPGYRPSISSRTALGSGEGHRRVCDLGEHPRAGSRPDRRVLETSAGRGAERAEPDRDQDRAQHLESRGPRRRRPQAGRRPRRADGDDRQHAAARGLGRRPDLVLQGRAGAVSGQDPRAREPAPRHRPEIGRLTVPSESGPVRIDNIARLERGLGPTHAAALEPPVHGQPDRRRGAGSRARRSVDDVRKMLAGLNMPPTMSFRLQGQSKILDETTANMIMAISLAMIFVYMVLASQFESFLQPIVIMLVLPIAVPFALFTLWVTGRTLNLWSALGMLLLLGIVKKNSILQVDYANVLRARGVPLREAIVESCRTRLRPILMTTTAIIAGLIPTSLGIGIGGTGRAAIAVTIIGGQSLCLFLTLLLVPVAYVKFDALEQAIVGQGARAWLSRVSAATVGRLRPAAESRQG